jgi:hypothetical protein
MRYLDAPADLAAVSSWADVMSVVTEDKNAISVPDLSI